MVHVSDASTGSLGCFHVSAQVLLAWHHIASFTSHIVVCRSCSCGSPGFANFSELLGAFYNGVRQRLPDFKHGVDITAKVTFSDLRHSQDFLF